MRYNGIIFIVVVLAVGCKSGPVDDKNTTPVEEVEMQDPWSLTFHKYSATEEACEETDCTFIDISIPELSGGSEEVRNIINEHIEANSRTSIQSQLPENLGTASYDLLCESFITGYKLFLMEFPDTEQKWNYSLSAEESEVGDGYFTLVLSIESYLGGAHPNTEIIAESFDLTTGEKINIMGRYDENLLSKLAESAFREAHKLEPDMSLNDGGFLFEDGNFSLPENMALTDSGLVLIYNTYEVASYAEGGTSFVLPYDMLGEK